MRSAPKHELKLPQYWTPQQALAAFEMIDLIRDRLWLLYGADIQRAMRNDRLPNDRGSVDPRQLCLPLDSNNDPF
jgi:hypothetical protein